eukprot:CAMPEP_0183715176 /NCGR_PEP_ID=MMETSP0737-20130205/9516_1 /TAXON_ID=385413 /ORGANISM="Thalassiosira miniscula, Strain CCMP1093" /LENGTH=464 /DNA_ID=CAMNT_0025944261 /DNA_START=95 /DNA_END=1489 /DNA_ORIENTATION=-
MKLHSSIYFTLALYKNAVASYCGCDTCTDDVWNALATDSNGSYTCGGRITWLQSANGYSEADACTKVSEEFPDGPCGPVCDPLKCNPPTNVPTTSPTPEVAYCGCDSCSQSVWDTLATDSDGTYSCGARISWLQTAQGYEEAAACTKVSNDFLSLCGPACDPTKCKGPSRLPTSLPSKAPTQKPSSPTSLAPSIPPVSSSEQKCGGAVDYTDDPNQTCQTYLWDPTGDSSMSCFAYGGPNDPCHLNNNNDQDDGLFKDPSLCLGDTFYLWDEPDTQGRDYTWAGRSWLAYSQLFASELEAMRARGTKVTSPLVKAGSNGVIEQNLRSFLDACGAACVDETDPGYIDILAINAFCGPWNGDAGCRGGASFIYNQAVSASNAFNSLPIYITNWSRLQTWDPADQLDAIDAVDEFFPSSGGVVERVYWFGARDYGGGSETTSYLTNTLNDGSTLGQAWRTKCDTIGK